MPEQKNKPDTRSAIPTAMWSGRPSFPVDRTGIARTSNRTRTFAAARSARTTREAATKSTGPDKTLPQVAKPESDAAAGWPGGRAVFVRHAPGEHSPSPERAARGQLARVSTRWRIGFLALLMLVAAGCKTTGVPAGAGLGPAPDNGVPPPDPAATATLAALATTYWDGRLEADPLEATAIGDRRFDDRMPDYSPGARDRRMEQLRDLQSRVASVPAVALSPTDRVTRALLLGEIDSDLARGRLRDGRLGGGRARRPSGFAAAPARSPAGAHRGRGAHLDCALAKDGRRHRPADREPPPRSGGGQGRHARKRSNVSWDSWTICWPRKTPTGRCGCPPRSPQELARGRAKGLRPRHRRGDHRRHPPGLHPAARRPARRDPARAPATRRTPASATCPTAPPATRT